MIPSIIFEDQRLLALSKPSGLMVEKDRANNPCLVDWVEVYLSKSKQPDHLFIANVNRLDRPVSGLILFAKRKSVLADLQEQFANRSVQKKYLAVTSNSPQLSEGLLTHWLYKDNLQKKGIIYTHEKKDAQKVELKYKIIGKVEGNFLWEIELLTGRYHQIRAQLSFLNCPIIGDEKYGSSYTYDTDAICLHSWKLKFKYPGKEEKELIAEVPENKIWKLFEETIKKRVTGK